MHIKLRRRDGRLNKAKLGALAFWAVAFLDVTGCSVAAAIFKLGALAVRPSWKLGVVVFNPVSVPLALGAGAALWLVGRWVDARRDCGGLACLAGHGGKADKKPGIVQDKDTYPW